MNEYPTITFRLNQDLLDRIDKVTGLHYVSRSTLIRTAIMLYLATLHPEEE